MADFFGVIPEKRNYALNHPHQYKSTCQDECTQGRRNGAEEADNELHEQTNIAGKVKATIPLKNQKSFGKSNEFLIMRSSFL